MTAEAPSVTGSSHSDRKDRRQCGRSDSVKIKALAAELGVGISESIIVVGNGYRAHLFFGRPVFLIWCWAIIVKKGGGTANPMAESQS
jgi:hypothetical protein